MGSQARQQKVDRDSVALLRHDGRHALRIARAEFVRTVRGIVANPRRLLGVGILLLFVGGGTLASLPVAFLAGRTARAIEAIPSFGLVATAVPVGLFLFAAFRTVERTGRIDAEPLVLLTVHPRAVVLGLVGAEGARLVTWFGVPVAAVVVAFAAGYGAPTVVLTMGLVVLPMAASTTVWGYAGGIAALRLLRSLPGVSRALKAVGYLVAIAVIVGSQVLGRYVAESGLHLDRFQTTLVLGPVADYVALGFVGTPLAQPVSAGALAALAAFVASTPVGLLVATRQATAYWHRDGPGRGEPSSATRFSGGGASGRIDGGGATDFSPPPPFAWRLSGRIAWGYLVRARRNPGELAHVIPLAFFVAPIGTMLMQTPASGRGPVVAGSGVLVGTWLCGAAFGLNPLGDDRPQLPVLLLTVAPPRSFVVGRLVAGLAVGVPVGVLVPFASIGMGTPPVAAAAFAVASVGACVAAGGLALGLGAGLPVYEERAFWGTETVVPSTIAVLTYAFVVGGGTFLGLVVVWYASTGHLSLSPFVAVGVGLYVLLTVGIPYGAFRYARRRVGRYHLE